MANPYMRDALLEQMDPTAAPAESQNKLGWNRPANKTPPQTPDGPGGSFDPGWGIETQRPPTSSAYTGTPPMTPSPRASYSQSLTTEPPDPTNPTEPTPGVGVPATPGAGYLEGQSAANASNAAATTGDPGASATTAAPTTYDNAGQNTYAGFNTQRAQDPTTSAKDAFYAATQKAPPMPKDKAGSEVWFNQYIKSALESAGYKVDWVKGDKAFVRTRENPQGEEIDFNQGADSDASSVAWQSNMAGQTTGGTGTGAPGSAGANQAQLNGALSDPAVLEKINAQIDALMKQGMTMEQIMALFNTTQQGTGA